MMNNRSRVLTLTFLVVVLMVAPLVAADDGERKDGVDIDLEAHAVPDLGNLTGQIMVQYIQEPSFHIDAASSIVVINREEV
jgi:hypothetical protein